MEGLLAMRVFGRLLILISLLLPLPGTAETAQQIYDRAEAAMKADDPETAAELFRGLLERLRAKKPRSYYELTLRYGEAKRQMGDNVAAIAAFDEALEGLSSSLKAEELASLRGTLGDALFYSFDYRRAADVYAQLVNDSQPVWQTLSRSFRFSLKLNQAQALFWSGQTGAMATLEKARNLIDPADKDARELDGFIDSIRARFLLSQGNLSAARSAARLALSKAGGITPLTSIADRHIRQDAALVAWFDKRPNDAVELSAMGGAARIGSNEKDFKSRFGRLVEGAMPKCNSIEGIKPDDVIVAEFSVSRSGTTEEIVPIYSSRPGQIENPFLAVIGKWNFSDGLQDKSIFWRSSYRVALRCQISPDGRLSALVMPKSIETQLKSAYLRQGLPDDTLIRIKEPAVLRKIEAALAVLEPKSDSDAAALLFALSLRSGTTNKARQDLFKRFDQIVSSNNQWLPLRFYQRSVFGYSDSNGVAIEVADKLPDPDVAAYLRAQQGLQYERLGKSKEAAILYQQIVSSTVHKDSPYRHFALLHLASLSVKSDLKQAEAYFQQTGLSPDQCSLYDVQPMPMRFNVSPKFDAEFDGSAWVHIELDVSQQGKAENVRAVASYPPFIYEEAFVDTYRRTRFTPIYRGNGEGCKGYSRTTTVLFGLAK